jgi:hypothetical protein
MGEKGAPARAPAAVAAGLLVLFAAACGVSHAAAQPAASRAAAGGPAVPSPGLSSSLQGVTCTSARNCWAVGSYDHGAGPLNHALHWDGTSWSSAGGAA